MLENRWTEWSLNS